MRAENNAKTRRAFMIAKRKWELMMLAPVLESWKMSLQSVHFLLFLPIVAGLYFVLPPRVRRVWLLLSCYYFYFFAAPQYLPVLLCGTLFSYAAARAIAASRTQRAKRVFLLFGLLGLLLALSFFKYNAAYESLLTPAFSALGLAYNGAYFTTAAALGISFYSFMAIGYLVDLYRGDVPLEKSLVGHALFLGFFPAVTSGPISRAGDLMPQLNKTDRCFESQNWKEGLRLAAVGFFKKLAVADTLVLFVNTVYADLSAYSGFTLSLAAVLFAIQLYFDFSGYTDIALGAALLFGIRLKPNFNTPFYATNFSGFWARWHMSLSTFLQDYVFMPLVWSRWPEKLPILGKKMSKPPMLSSILIVFLISGIWHGDTLCFVVWGLLQAAFRIGEELLHRFVGKPKKRLPRWQRIGKTAVVLVLWVESLVFFRVGLTSGGSVTQAVSALVRQFSGISFTQTAQALYSSVAPLFYGYGSLVALFFVFTALCTAGALYADWVQCFRLKGTPWQEGLSTLRPALRWAIYYGLVLCAFAGFIIGSGGFGGASFLYGGF